MGSGLKSGGDLAKIQANQQQMQLTAACAALDSLPNGDGYDSRESLTGYHCVAFMGYFVRGRGIYGQDHDETFLHRPVR